MSEKSRSSRKHEHSVSQFEQSLLFKLKMVFLVKFFTISIHCLPGNLVAQGQNEQELLQKIITVREYSESLMKNLMCNTEFDEYIAPGVIEENQSSPVRRQREITYIYEPEGRIRIEEILLSAKGLDLPEGTKSIMSDNLKEERTFFEMAGSRSMAIKSRSGFTHSLRKPTTFFSEPVGVPFSEMLKIAIQKKTPITIKPVESNSAYVQLAIPWKQKENVYEHICILDSEKMFYPVNIETYRGGQLARKRISVVHEIQKDIWFPVEAQYQSFDKNGEIIEDIKMKVKSVEVNLSELKDSLFEIQIPEGTRVVDSRGNARFEYIVGAGREADMMLDELASLALSGEYVQLEKEGLRKIKRVTPTEKSKEEKMFVQIEQQNTPTNDDINENLGKEVEPRNTERYFFVIAAISVCLVATLLFVRHRNENHRKG